MARMAKRAMTLLIAGLMFLAQAAMAAGDGRGPLVSAQWLLENRESAGLLVLDASPPPLHAAGHIPGAVSASPMFYGAKEDSAAAMEHLFRAWGLDAGRKVVLYDSGEPMWATRLHFDLHRHGFPAENLLVLDGGLAGWKAAGGAVTKDPTPSPPMGPFKVTGVDEAARVRLPEVLAATGEPGKAVLVEALDPAWHFGETAFFDRGGHIPHGVMLPSKDFYNADMTFKSPGEIRRMLDYLGVRPDREVLTYCGGGIAASVPYFALKFLLGYPRVRVFMESEMGWLRDERVLPYWTYDAPYLARETPWLRTWGGRMMRMYGTSNLSVVDVRPAEEFRFGHVPFAANIPAEVFRKHLGTPEALAGILSKAGVEASHEAVVVSGAGLTKEAALAFLALERLGQARVSVFIDSHEKAARTGLALATEPDLKKTSARPAGNYAPAPRPGVLVADADETRGAYPKVFVASGKAMPAKVPDGRVVHVPYTDLLDAGNVPKAAKDLWKILAKAGVPRYAELVAFADDPGDAAVTYFILRLMGFPDVKVLAK